MDVCRSRTISLIVMTMILFIFQQANAASKLNYQGRILKADNTPLEAASVSMTIKIKSPGSEGCILFQETHTVNMTNSGGLFSLEIGSGTRANSSVDGGLSLNTIISNSAAITSLPTCASGSSYTPTSGDSRLLVMSFDDGTGEQQVDPLTVNSVAYAVEAEQVSGYAATNLLRVNGGTATAFTPTNFTELLALINGTSTQYLKSAASGIQMVGTASDPSTPASGQIWYNTADNQFKFYDGTAVRSLQTTAGDQQGVTSLNGLTAATQTFSVGTSGTSPGFTSSTSTHTLNIPMASATGVTAGLLSKADYDSFNGKQPAGNYITAITGDLTLSGFTSGSATGTIANNAVTTVKINDGAVTNDKITSMSIAKLTNAAGVYFNYKPNNTACADNEILKYDSTLNSGAGGWKCSTAASGGGSSDAGDLTSGTLNAARLPAFSGDVTSSAGSAALTLSTVSIAKGGTGATTREGAINALLPTQTSNSGKVLQSDGTNVSWVTPSSGSISSITLTVPSFMSVSGSPLTASGTLGISISDQAANTVLAGPTSGMAGAPSFRVLKNADIRNAAGTGMFINQTGACSNGQALGHNSVNDTLECQSFTVTSVGGKTSTEVAQSVTDTVAATASNTASAIVKRDSSGNFAANILTVSQTRVSQVNFFDSGSNSITMKAPTTLSGNLTFTLPDGAGSNGQVLTTNGSGVLSWSTPSGGGGGVTSIGVTAPLASTGGATPTLSMPAATTSVDGHLTSADWNTFNNKLGKALADGKIFVGNSSGDATAVTVSGDASISNAGAVSVNQIKGVAVSGTAPTSGNFMKYNGTNWSGSNINLTDLKSSVSGNLFSSPNCTSTETLSWSSVSDQFTCISITGLAASAITSGTFDAARIPSLDWSKITSGKPTTLSGYGITDALQSGGNSLGAVMTLGTNDNYDLTFETNNAEVVRMVASTGNVGIANNNPSVKLQVSGTIAGNTNKIASGAAVNLGLSNTHVLASVGAAAITLTNPVDGGVYTVIVSDTTSRTYTFSGCTNSYFSPANSATTTGTRSIYGLTMINTSGSNYDCYITWSTGYQ